MIMAQTFKGKLQAKGPISVWTSFDFHWSINCAEMKQFGYDAEFKATWDQFLVVSAPSACIPWSNVCTKKFS